mmetsp:Transcript_71770/g.153405  ORF Transcript_71770/g.153405 Transcript_71770/m.153405 type:complete len:213 (+) Transcript_71770:228-866(+)
MPFVAQVSAYLMLPAGVESDLDEAHKITVCASQVIDCENLRACRTAPDHVHNRPRRATRCLPRCDGGLQEARPCSAQVTSAEAHILLPDAPCHELQQSCVVPTVIAPPQQCARGVAVEAMQKAVRHGSISCDGVESAKLLGQPLLHAPAASLARALPCMVALLSGAVAGIAAPISSIIGAIHRDRPTWWFPQHAEILLDEEKPRLAEPFVSD